MRKLWVFVTIFIAALLKYTEAQECGQKQGCTRLGGTCQSKEDNCDGERIDGKKYCKNPSLCGCCLEVDMESKKGQNLHSAKDPSKHSALAAALAEKSTTCGGTLNVVPGRIDHPESAARYGNNEFCIWIINSPLPLFFYFSKFNIETTYDFILARDGVTLGSSEIGKYSGKDLSTTFTSSGSTHITFDSDENVVEKGFVLHWRVHSTQEQCEALGGVCLKTGDRCTSMIEIIENSCEDRCVCCKKQDNAGNM